MRKGKGKRKKEKDEKVEIVYRPVKQVVIMDYFQFSMDTLTQMFARIIHSGLPVMAQWAEGVLFVYFPLTPDTDHLVENYMKGKIFWSSVNFALMPKYAPSIKVAGLEIPVIDVSKHPVLSEAARWLKQRARKM
ncbi:hypothetical protein DRO55_06115 [Candidatus Bathyarchaeota archaeon]|mgnify:CR=1 FL=1|nr:MAG: hypothetical protein DRO55_06115 [Candidatus Bathyarchaeota archaeon]